MNLNQIDPTPGTATERRRKRMDVRHTLGISRDPAPTLRSLMHAIKGLDLLLHMTTGGRMRLVVWDNSDQGYRYAEQLLSLDREEQTRRLARERRVHVQ